VIASIPRRLRRAFAIASSSALLIASAPLAAWATTYFSQGSVPPNTLASWNTVRGGGGASPANFTTANDVFVIQNTHNMGTTATWAVAGSNAKIQIESGGTLTANHLVSVPQFQVDNGGTYVHNAISGASNGVATDVPGSTTRSFGASSSVEFQKWANGGTGPVALPAVTWGNLKINVAALGGSWQQSGGLTSVLGNLTIQATGGTTREFRLNANSPAASSLTVTGDVLVFGGIFNVTSGTAIETFNIGGNLAVSGGTFTATGAGPHNINFTGGGANSSITLVSGTYTPTALNYSVAPGKTLSVSGAFAPLVAAGRTMVVNGTFQIDPTTTLGTTGTWSYGAGASLTFNEAASRLVDGTSPFWPAASGPTNVNVSGAGTVAVPVARTVAGNLTFTNGAMALGAADLTVNGTLALGSSKITTATAKVVLPASATLTRGSGYIVGTLQKNVATGSNVSRTFEVGDGSNYAPVSVSFANVSGAGDLVASTASPVSVPAQANLSASKFVNRSWTVTNSGVSFSTYDATLNFNPGDIQGGGDPNNFIVAKNTSGTWTNPTVGTRTATSTQATGLSALSDFYVGESGAHTISATAGANGSITPSGAVPVNDGASQGFTIAANAGYVIQDVLVDGVSQGAVASYTFTNVTADHTISASFAADPTSTINAVSPAGFVTTVVPSVGVPVTLSRTVTTPILGYSVTLQLSGLTSTAAAITEGGFLSASGANTSFQVTDNGGGSYTVDGVTLGVPCGSSATSGTLFTVGVGSALAGGSGTVTVTSVTLRDCSNATLPSAVGTAATVNVDRSPPSVVVNSPSNSEHWVAGSVQAITWTVTDAEGIAANGLSIEYSTDLGANWLPVASGLANTGSYDWTIPSTPTTQGVVRVTALDVHANAGQGTSTISRPFTIQGTSTTVVTTSPNPSVFGQGVTLTGTVSPAVNSGLLEFFDGATSLGGGTPSGGVFSFSVSNLSAGTHSITATYHGSTLVAPSTSAPVSHVVNPSATAIGFSVDPNPRTGAGSVSMNATVTAVPPGGGQPTGSIEFFDGATSLGTYPYTVSTLKQPSPPLAVGTHSLTAVYSGSASHAGSTSSAVSVVVNPAPTTTTLASSPNPSVVGQSVTLTATVVGTLPLSGSPGSGSVEFFDGATSLGTAPVSAGSASLNTATLALGGHSLSAVFSGDASYTGSTSAALAHTVNQSSSVTTLTATPEPSVHGQSVTLTATVAASPPGSGTPTGTVEFFKGATSLGTAPLSGGTASIASGFLNVGAPTFTAVYSGNTDYTGSTSAVYTHIVNMAFTTTVVGTSPDPSNFGDLVTITATCTAVAPGAGTPNGPFTFFDNGNFLGQVMFVPTGTASITTSALTPGSHSITAVGGDGNFFFHSSTSAPVTQVVNQASSTTTLASSPNPSNVGQSVSLTANVSPASSTGTVEFFDGVSSLGTSPVAGGSAALSTAALSAGSHSLTAVYSGDTGHAGSTSNTVTQVVTSPGTTTTLATTPNPSVFGESVTLTATVSPAAATGTVEFFEGATSLGTAPLSGGTASIATSAFAVGSHVMHAVYSGDGTYTTSTSPAHTHTVDPASSSTSLASGTNPSTFGQSVAFTATVAPSGATGSVEFLDGASSLGTSPLVAGSAQLITSALAAGSHTITAVYSGDASYSGSTSNLVTQVVNAASSSVTLVAAPDPGVYQDPVTLTATVAPSGATGSVEFFDGVTSLGTSPVASGSAQLITSSLVVGPHSLTAHYSGDGSYSGATSTADPLEVKAKIVATAGANGSLSPPGTTLYSLNATPSYTFSADPGYHVASVTVDGGAAPLTSPYTFAAVSSNHTIDVQFAVNPAVPAITTLAATQVRTGNDGDGNTKITLTWTAVPAGSTVEVWRKGYGNYPEYDDGPTPGSVPPAPGAYPPAGWTLTTVTTPGGTDEPGARDFWYYVAYVTDTFGTRSPVSNRTTGTLSYHLGDVSDGTTPGLGDNQVSTSDLSALGAHYGIYGAAVDAVNYLDVGPTTDLSVNARPMTDNKVNFEDLVLFAINYYPVASAPQAHATPAASSQDALVLTAPPSVYAGEDVAVRISFTGTGRVLAMSARLAWDPAVVHPVSFTAGDAVLEQGALLFSGAPGSVDGAVFTGTGQGFTGDGEFATLHFQVVAAGDPKIAFAGTDARDNQNHTVILATGVTAVTPKSFVTAFAPAMPNPFGRSTTFAFSLAKAGRADLEVFSVDGRRVRTITSGLRDAGEYRLEWNGADDSGHRIAPGVYYARLVTAQGRFTRVVTRLE